jgi:hypothetical protein
MNFASADEADKAENQHAKTDKRLSSAVNGMLKPVSVGQSMHTMTNFAIRALETNTVV